jgi:hypothetical protein
MKSAFLIITLLFFAASANAQHHSTPSFSGTSMWGGQYNARTAGRSGSGGDGYGSGYGEGISHHGYGGGGHLSAPSHAIGQTSNDGAYIPTTLMDYNEAVALGKQQLAMGGHAASAAPGPSLADAARAYRAAKIKVGSATLETGALQGSDLRVPSVSGVFKGDISTVTEPAGPSLADVARDFRAAMHIAPIPHAFAVQDNSGRLYVCDADGAHCN